MNRRFLLVLLLILIVAVSLWSASTHRFVLDEPLSHDVPSSNLHTTKATQSAPSAADPSAIDTDAPLAEKNEPEEAKDITASFGSSSSSYANGAANRSPPRPKRSLLSNAEEKRAAQTVQDVRCWDQLGGSRWVPDWAPALLGAAAPNYDVIQAESVEDPWTILIGWVPDKFMPPQKDGVKANGDILQAPTKGRDPQYYLDEYNATWHRTAVSGGSTHHFQLVHRNALAVCVRERLHIHQMFCSATGMQKPLQIYYCPCRKCREGGKKATSSKLRDAFPDFKMPRLHNVTWENKPVPKRKVIPPPYTGECVEARSAPWLAPKNQVSFPYEGLQHNLRKLVEVQANDEKIVHVVMFNKFWVDHLHNFVFSMKRRARLSNLIVATMDSDALALCVENRLPCFDATPYAELEPDMVGGAQGAQKGHTRKVTEEMSWIKPRLAVAVLTLGYGFLMVDLDMSWNSNPMAHINVEGTADIVHQCDSPSKFSINSGFYFARSNPRTVQYFQNIQVFRPPENSDQTTMKLFSRYDHTHGATNTCLDKWIFNMKCNYKVAGSVKRDSKKQESFKWKPFDRDRKKFFWSIHHATCLNGAQAKLIYLRTMNAWFLDDLEEMCNAKSVCMIDDEGKRIDITGAKTTHSTKYTTATDDLYLKERH